MCCVIRIVILFIKLNYVIISSIEIFISTWKLYKIEQKTHFHTKRAFESSISKLDYIIKDHQRSSRQYGGTKRQNNQLNCGIMISIRVSATRGHCKLFLTQRLDRHIHYRTFTRCLFESSINPKHKQIPHEPEECTLRNHSTIVHAKKKSKINSIIWLYHAFSHMLIVSRSIDDCAESKIEICRIHTKNHKTIYIIPMSETTQFRKSVKSTQSVIISVRSSFFLQTMVLYGRCISINDDSLTIFFNFSFDHK